MITFQELVDVRRHLNIPVSGVIRSGAMSRNTRLDTMVQYLSAEEETVIFGRPCAVLQILGPTVNGQAATLTITPVGGSPFAPITYTVTPQDVAAPDPRLRIANNFGMQVLLANIGIQCASGALEVTAQPAILPPFAQMTLVSFTFNFTISLTLNGLPMFVLNSGGYRSPKLKYTDDAGNVQFVYGMLPICNFLEESVYAASDNIEMDSAGASGPQGGVRLRHDELNQREILYQRAVRRLSKMFGNWGN